LPRTISGEQEWTAREAALAAISSSQLAIRTAIIGCAAARRY